MRAAGSLQSAHEPLCQAPLALLLRRWLLSLQRKSLPGLGRGAPFPVEVAVALEQPAHLERVQILSHEFKVGRCALLRPACTAGGSVLAAHRRHLAI